MPEAPKDQATAAKEQVAKEAEARKKAGEELAKRMENAKPTPTQEENDLARLGVDVPNKQDDGSGPEVHFVVQKVITGEDKPAAASYQTRQLPPQQQKPKPE